jgi:hypothetical protein
VKNIEYREPEFTVVKTAAQDVMTASVESLLDIITGDWDTGSQGGGIGFGL